MEEGLLKGGGPWKGQSSSQQAAQFGPAGPILFSIIITVTQTGHEETGGKALFLHSANLCI